MYYNEFDVFDWLHFPFNENQNYNGSEYSEKLKSLGARKWLATLPMFEYAHVLTVLTALRCGGDPDKFEKDLFEKRLCMVLTSWHRKLGRYRYLDALKKCNFDSLREKVTDVAVQEELRKLRAYALEIRKKMRRICHEFELEIKAGI